MSASGRSVTLLGVARNLGMRRDRLLLIASFLTAISLYSFLLSSSPLGSSVVFYALVFVSSSIPTALSVSDSVSGKSGELFRFLGAKRGTVAAAVLASVSLSGLCGIVAGLGFSTLFSLLTPPFRVQLLPQNVISVILSSSAGMVSGAAAGVAGWKKSG